MQIDKDSAGVRLPPPLIYLGALVVGLALERVIGRTEIPLLGGDLLETAGALALVLGGGTVLSALGLFRRAETAPEPWKTASTLVTDGVFRWTRNPMYLGMALAYAGIAMMLDSLTLLAMLIPAVIVVQKEVIEREEAYLAAKFGAPYLAYKASVRRWI